MFAEFECNIENPYHIRRYVFEHIGSNMYVLADEVSGSALVIDPHESEMAYKYLCKCGIKNVLILLTHEHYDHTSGVNWLKSKFQCELCCHEDAAKSIAIEKNNRPLVLAMILKEQGKGDELLKVLNTEKPYKCETDISFAKTFEYQWSSHRLKFTHLPGHSKGSCCIELDEKYVFTGDSLIPDVKTITRFPGGSEQQYNDLSIPYLEGISEDKYILPGHGEAVKRSQLEIADGVFRKK